MRWGSIWLGNRNQTSTLYFFLGGGRGVGLATYSCQVNSSYFRVFSTGFDHEKRPVHRFWDFPPCEKHCESLEVFHTGSFKGIFTGQKLTGFFTGFRIGSDPVKNALFTGSQWFHTLWKRCENHVRKHVKLNSSHVFSQFYSQVFHSIFTCFYPIVI